MGGTYWSVDMLHRTMYRDVSTDRYIPYRWSISISARTDEANHGIEYKLHNRKITRFLNMVGCKKITCKLVF